jgi:hypothetical protein
MDVFDQNGGIIPGPVPVQGTVAQVLPGIEEKIPELAVRLPENILPCMKIVHVPHPHSLSKVPLQLIRPYYIYDSMGGNYG